MFGAYQGGLTQTVCDFSQRRGGLEARQMDHIHQVDGHDLCRVHVEPSGHLVEAEITTVDDRGQFSKKQVFFVRLNNGTRAITEDRERQWYISQRWGGDP